MTDTPQDRYGTWISDQLKKESSSPFVAAKKPAVVKETPKTEVIKEDAVSENAVRTRAKEWLGAARDRMDTAAQDGRGGSVSDNVKDARKLEKDGNTLKDKSSRLTKIAKQWAKRKQ